MDSDPLRVGVLTPHAAAGPEVELPDMASGRVTAVVARVRPAGATASWTPPSAASELRALAAGSSVDRAAAPFRVGSVEALAFSSTSSGYALGQLILTANQVLLWSILTATRRQWDVTGYGRLLRLPSD